MPHIIGRGSTGRWRDPAYRRDRVHRYTAGSLVDRPGSAVSGPCPDPGKGRALGGEVVVGDLDDERSVAEAMIGVDRVFLNAGGAVPAPGEQPMVRQQKTVIDAARAAGARMW